MRPARACKTLQRSASGIATSTETKPREMKVNNLNESSESIEDVRKQIAAVTQRRDAQRKQLPGLLALMALMILASIIPPYNRYRINGYLEFVDYFMLGGGLLCAIVSIRVLRYLYKSRKKSS
jgi:hypothetical protein